MADREQDLHKIAAFISHDGALGRAAVKELQLSLHRAGFDRNYKIFKDDGLLQKKTCEDVVNFLRARPEALASLSETMQRKLIAYGFENNLKEMRAQNPHVIDPRVVDPAAVPQAAVPQIQTPPPAKTSSPETIPAAKGADNGFGVPMAAIEQSWSAIEGGLKTEFSPVSYNASNTGQGRPLVVIDPGHFVGEHKGAKSKSGLTEVDVVDPVALSLAKNLNGRGFDVAFTRNPGAPARHKGIVNGFTEPETRPAFAHKLASVMNSSRVYFLSLHANDFKGGKSVAGSDILAGSADNHDGVVDFGRPALSQSSLGLAQSIQENLKVSPSGHVRVRTADPTVLTKFDEMAAKTKIPAAAALAELAFLSNPADAAALEKIMHDPDATAEQLAKGIADYDACQVLPAQTSGPVIVAARIPGLKN